MPKSVPADALKKLITVSHQAGFRLDDIISLLRAGITPLVQWFSRCLTPALGGAAYFASRLIREPGHPLLTGYVT